MAKATLSKPDPVVDCLKAIDAAWRKSDTACDREPERRAADREIEAREMLLGCIQPTSDPGTLGAVTVARAMVDWRDVLDSDGSPAYSLEYLVQRGKIAEDVLFQVMRALVAQGVSLPCGANTYLTPAEERDLAMAAKAGGLA